MDDAGHALGYRVIAGATPQSGSPQMIREGGEVAKGETWSKGGDAMWFKSCPRCQMGDVVLDRDIHGRYILCLQCGYMKDLGAGVQVDTVFHRLRGTNFPSREGRVAPLEREYSASFRRG